MRGLFRLVIGGVILLVSRVMDRFRPAPSREGRVVLRYSAFLFVVGLLGLFFCGAALAVGVRLHLLHPGRVHPLSLVWFVLFGLFFLWMVLEYLFVRHTVTEEGMEARELFGKRVRIRWDGVVRVYYSPLAGWFGVVDADGKVIRVSAMMLGLQEFARVMLSRVPPEVMEPEARFRLEEAARGNPPEQKLF